MTKPKSNQKPPSSHEIMQLIFPMGKVFLRKKDIASVDTRENKLDIRTEKGDQFLLKSEEQLEFILE